MAINRFLLSLFFAFVVFSAIPLNAQEPSALTGFSGQMHPVGDDFLFRDDFATTQRIFERLPAMPLEHSRHA